MGVMSGVDPVRLTNLADELEADAYRRLAIARKRKKR
ncbi:MAG: hypothetical protein RLZZ408_157 [Verrucomicrobiota bacterium]